MALYTCKTDVKLLKNQFLQICSYKNVDQHQELDAGLIFYLTKVIQNLFSFLKHIIH